MRPDLYFSPQSAQNMQRPGRRPGYTTTDGPGAENRWQDEEFEYDSGISYPQEQGWSGSQNVWNPTLQFGQQQNMQGYQDPGEYFQGAQGQPLAAGQAGPYQQDYSSFEGSYQGSAWAMPQGTGVQPGYQGYNTPLGMGNPQASVAGGPTQTWGPQASSGLQLASGPLAGAQSWNYQTAAPLTGQPPLPPDPTPQVNSSGPKRNIGNTIAPNQGPGKPLVSLMDVSVNPPPALTGFG